MSVTDVDQAKHHLMKKVGNATWSAHVLCGGLRPAGWDTYKLLAVVDELVREGRLVKNDAGLIQLP